MHSSVYFIVYLDVLPALVVLLLLHIDLGLQHMLRCRLLILVVVLLLHRKGAYNLYEGVVCLL